MNDPVELHGFYFPAGTSRRVDATLVSVGESFQIREHDDAITHDVDLAELTDRLANVSRKIVFTDGSVFECADNDAVDMAFGQHRAFSSNLSRAEGSWKIVTAALAGCVVLLVGLYVYGIPLLARGAVAVTPSAALTLMDRSVLETADRAVFDESNLPPNRQRELGALFNELVEASGLDDPRPTLLFRDGGRIGANAVALPGGTVILTDQLEALAENDDELAGVLAHELGHVEENHGLRQLYRSLGIAFMVSVIAGDGGQLFEDLVAQAALLDTFSYSRRFEYEADEYSVELINQVGRNPQGFVDLIERVFKEAGVDGDGSNWLSTHPGNDERRERVREILEEQSN